MSITYDPFSATRWLAEGWAAHAMMTCKEVARFVSAGTLEAAPWRQRLAVRLHFVVCGVALFLAFAIGDLRGQVTVKRVPEFEVLSLDGRTISSRALAGKVVVVNFWATWCSPCRAEMVDLANLQKKYSRELQVIGISEDTIPLASVQRFVRAIGATYPIAMSSPSIRGTFGEVEGVPLTLVLDREGRIVERHVGQLDGRGFEGRIRTLAGLDPPRQ